MATNKPVTAAPARVRKAVLKFADVEYRVLWNDEKGEWDVLRNGSRTAASARNKKQSAIDSAIRDAKAELETSKAAIVVTCLQGRKLETLWKGGKPVANAAKKA